MTKHEFVLTTYNTLRSRGVIHTQTDFANMLGYGRGMISRALAGDENYLSDNLIARIHEVVDGQKPSVPLDAIAMFPSLDASIQPQASNESILVIPTEAMAGTLGDFANSVAAYDCERMVSPIKGADYAIKVCGDSMTPEYPSGCQLLIKKVNEKAFIEWGKVYVLDTENGAVIKKVLCTDKEGVIECVSLNPEYPPFKVDTAYIHGWYRILMVLCLK